MSLNPAKFALYLQQGIGKSVIGVGGVLDSTAGAEYLDKDMSVEDAVKKFGEEALLSGAGDLVLGGGFKLAKGTYQGVKQLNEALGKTKDAVTGEVTDGGANALQKIKNLVDQAPIIGDITNANMAGIKRDADKYVKNLDAQDIGSYKDFLANEAIKLENKNVYFDPILENLDEVSKNLPDGKIKNGINFIKDKLDAVSHSTPNPQSTKDKEALLNLYLKDETLAKPIRDNVETSAAAREGGIWLADNEAKKWLERLGLDVNQKADLQNLYKTLADNKNETIKIFDDYVKSEKSNYKATIDEIAKFSNGQKLQLDYEPIGGAIDNIVANYADFYNRDAMRIALGALGDKEGVTLDKALDARRWLNRAERRADTQSIKNQTQELRQALDDAIFKALGDDTGALRNLLKDADVRYAKMKGLSKSSLFENKGDIIKNGFDTADLYKLMSQNNDVWQNATQGLSDEAIAKLEINALRDSLLKNLEDLGTGKGLKVGKIAEKLVDVNFISKEASTLKDEILNYAKNRGGLDSVIDSITKELKAQKANGSSLSQSITGRATTAAVSHAYKRLAKYIPIIGKDPAKYAMIYDALLKAKNLNEFQTGVQKVFIDPRLNNAQRLEILKAGQSKEFWQEAQNALKVKNEAIETLKGLPKSAVIRGEGWIASEKQTTQYTDRIKFELGNWLKNNTDINDNPITASINYLFNHHHIDGMFNTRREVINLIKDVLDSMPEIVQKRDDGSYYLAKSLRHEKSNAKSKMGDIVIDPMEAENYIKHANLKGYNGKMREAVDSKDAPLLTHRSESAGALSENSQNSRSGSNKLLSTANKSIIPQSDKKADKFELSGIEKLVADDLELNKFEKAVSEFSKEGKEFIDGIKKREKETKDKIDEISKKAQKINSKKSKK